MAAAGALLASLAAADVRAARFEPEVHAEIGHSDNVYYYPEAEEPTPDWYSRLSLVLPVRGESPASRWEILYEPSLQRYRDVTELDHDEHGIQVGVESVPERRTSFAAGAGWETSQTQGNTTSTDVGDLFLAPRYEVEIYRAGLSVRRGEGARLFWTAEARGLDSDYTPVEEPGTGLPAGTLEDRREYEAVAGLGRVLSRAAEVGLEYRFRRHELDLTGDENNHLLSVTISRGLSEAASIYMRLGGFRRDLAAAQAEDGSGDSSDSGLQIAAGLDVSSRNGDLHVEGSHGPSSGGAFAGTSTDTVVAIQWGGERAERFRWDTAARWAMRDPTIEEDPTIRSMGVGAGAEWFPRREIGLRLRGDWVRQSGVEDPMQNGSFVAATAGIGWYPGGVRPGTGMERR